MIGLVATLQRRITFHNAHHLNTAASRLFRPLVPALHLQLCIALHLGKHRLTAAIHLIHAGAGGLGVGQVAGGGVHAHGLRVHAGTGDIKNIDQRHTLTPLPVYSPRSALVRPLNLPFRN